MILDLNDKEICESSTSAAVSFKFLNVKDWAFVDAAPKFFKLNISNDSDSIKLLRSAWILVAIFWTYCFKRRVRCRFWKRNIVAYAFWNCWLKKIMISSFCYIVEFLFSSALRWREFSLRRIFFSRLSKHGVWTLINFSLSDISFKIRFVWSDIINYASSLFFSKNETIKIVKLWCVSSSLTRLIQEHKTYEVFR